MTHNAPVYIRNKSRHNLSPMYMSVPHVREQHLPKQRSSIWWRQYVPNDRAWNKRSVSVPQEKVKPTNANYDTDCGPGHCNKYAGLEASQCYVMMHPHRGTVTYEGRDFWRNTTNPYQFDKTFVNREDHMRRRASEQVDSEQMQEVLDRKRREGGRKGLRSYKFLSHEGGSGRGGTGRSSEMICTARSESTCSGDQQSWPSSRSHGSVPERIYSVRKSQSFEGTNTVPFTVHQRSPYELYPHKSNFQNTVVHLARDKPGYQGFIVAKDAENIVGKTWNMLVNRCDEMRGYHGVTNDGVHGRVQSPDRWESAPKWVTDGVPGQPGPRGTGLEWTRRQQPPCSLPWTHEQGQGAPTLRHTLYNKELMRTR